MTDDTKLLPCPFCGAAAKATDEMFGSVIHCDHLHTCPLDGHEKLAAAVREWNSRATPAEDVRAVVDEPLDPVHGDVLPPVGSTVQIKLGDSGWFDHTVTGYYVWPNHGLDKYVHRVFVRVKDAQGTQNARLLSDIRTPQ